MSATVIIPVSTDFYTIDVDGTVIWNETLTDEEVEAFEGLLTATGNFKVDNLGFFVHVPTYEAHKAELEEAEAEAEAEYLDLCHAAAWAWDHR